MRTLGVVKRRFLHLALRGTEVGLNAIGVRRPSALLLLGHMRSGSTLLLHLLLTNPAISAMGERNATYATREDLARLVIATRLVRRTPFARLRYVVDQVNHNRFTPSRRVLEDPRAHLVFLLRKPKPSLASLLELSRTHYQGSWSITRAVDYYVDRLQTLADFGARLDFGGRAAFITYEDLTAEPTETLARLQEFLGMPSGFSETYDTHSFTGKRGDPGSNIRTGRIGRPRSIADKDTGKGSGSGSGSATDTAMTPGDDLPADELARATHAYAQCRDTLLRFALPATARGVSG